MRVPKRSGRNPNHVSPDAGLASALIIATVFSLAGCGEERPPLAPPAQAAQLDRAGAEQARRLIAHYGCVACHTVPGVRGPTSRVGPALENLALRGYIGGVLPNTPDNMVRWLVDPPSVDPRTAMPDIGVSHEDAQIITAYLLGRH